MTNVTARLDKSYTVFLVGIQARSLRSLLKAMYIGRQMTKMQKQLNSDSKSGHIWGKNFVTLAPFTTLYLSYWQSPEDIHKFVADKKFAHIEAAKEYFQKFDGDPGLGVWHETYVVQPGQVETLYRTMSKFGFSAFLPVQPAVKDFDTFLKRLGRN